MPKCLTVSHDQFVIILHQSDTDPLYAALPLIYLLLETAVKQAWLRNMNYLGLRSVISLAFNIFS